MSLLSKKIEIETNSNTESETNSNTESDKQIETNKETCPRGKNSTYIKVKIHNKVVMAYIDTAFYIENHNEIKRGKRRIFINYKKKMNDATIGDAYISFLEKIIF